MTVEQDGNRRRPNAVPFLEELEPRPLRRETSAGMTPRGSFLGRGDAALRVLALDAEDPPGTTALRQAWKDHRRGRAAPLLAVALLGDRAWVCGPAGDAPRVFGMQVGQAERLCRRALEEPDGAAALRYLLDALPASQTDTRLPGFRNEGLLTDHVLRHHAEGAGPGLAEARARGAAALGAQDAELLGRLGFGVERLDAATSVLRAGDERRAVAVLLHAGEVEEATSPRFPHAPPIALALDRADLEGLPLGRDGAAGPRAPVPARARRGRRPPRADRDLDRGPHRPDPP
jgi:hypothetical protein